MPAIDTAESAIACRPIALWSTAIIRIRMFELARLDNERSESTKLPQYQAMIDSIRRSLACSVSDPFLWLVQYWAGNTQTGTKSDYWKYLEMSYRLGPNEGWVALKRSPIAFAHYKSLPSDLKVDAVAELMSLINSEFYQQAADIIGGPARPFWNEIVPHLLTLHPRNREAFAKVVYDRDLQVKIPGILPPSIRH